MIKNFRSYDLFGNIALVKFPRGTKISDKKKFSKKIMDANKSIKTVLEKSGKFKGRLRKMQTKFIAGEKTKEALYKENDCVFRFNVDKTYFSSRLSNERKEIAGLIKKNDKVLVMFAGVAPYSIILARKSGAEVYSNELNREANKYGRLNAQLNKVKDKIVFLDGDIKKIVKKCQEGRLSEGNRRCPRFDVIVMPRPRLKDSFLKEAFALSKKGTRIFYYDFCEISKTNSITEKIKSEAAKSRKKIKILKVKNAGEIAPYKVRVRVDFKLV